MFVAVLHLAVLVATVFLQVVARNYLHFPLLWTNELAVLTFIWSIFLGSAVAVRRRKHYVVEILPPSFVKTNVTMDVLADVVIMAMIYVMVVDGYGYTMMGFSRLSTSISMPQAYFFLPIPLSGIAMFLFNIEVLVEDVKKAMILMKGGKVDGPVNLIND